MDVAVIGGGAAGCVTALAFARRGARVLLLEAHPGASTRLAGEWLHPAGVRVLESLGLEIPAAAEHPPGRGFIVVPADGAPAIRLEYPEEAVALTCDHAALIAALRDAAAAHPNVTYLPHAHPVRLEGQRLTFEREGHAADSVTAGAIVGADGRSAVSRLRRRSISVWLSGTGFCCAPTNPVTPGVPLTSDQESSLRSMFTRT